MRHLLLLAALALRIPACGASDGGGSRAPVAPSGTTTSPKPSTETVPDAPPVRAETETIVLEVSGMT